MGSALAHRASSRANHRPLVGPRRARLEARRTRELTEPVDPHATPTGTTRSPRRRAPHDTLKPLVATPGPSTSTRARPPGRKSSRTRRNSRAGSPPIPTLPSRSSAVPHRPSLGSGSKTERCVTAAPRARAAAAAAARRVDAERGDARASKGNREPTRPAAEVDRRRQGQPQRAALPRPTGRTTIGHSTTDERAVRSSTVGSWRLNRRRGSPWATLHAVALTPSPLQQRGVAIALIATACGEP